MNQHPAIPALPIFPPVAFIQKYFFPYYDTISLWCIHKGSFACGNSVCTKVTYTFDLFPWNYSGSFTSLYQYLCYMYVYICYVFVRVSEYAGTSWDT